MGIKLLFASHKKAVIAFITTAVVVTACIIGYLIYRDKYLAITMRIQRLVGDVVLTDDSGNEINLKEKMRLASGQNVNTAGQSLIMVSLDDTKLLTMEESSLAEIRTKRKQLEFHLIEGNLFFNVTEKLAENESFDVVTSTMVCGIRGTSAYVGHDASGHEILMVTDGVVHVVATNPRTKEVTETDVYPGQMITVYLDEEAEGDATISLKLSTFRAEDLPALALDSIAKNEELRRRIVDACGFQDDRLLELAEVSCVKGISMYGTAAKELSDKGIEDSIPLMGCHATEMVLSANSACDIAEEDLPVEIAILKGLRGVLDVGIEAEYEEVPLSELMTGARASYNSICYELKDSDFNRDEVVSALNVINDTFNNAASEMISSELTTDEVKEVFEATTQLISEAITAAKENPEMFAIGDGEDGSNGNGSISAGEALLISINRTSNYIKDTVNAEMIKESNGEETVIALLGKLTQTDDNSEEEDEGEVLEDEEAEEDDQLTGDDLTDKKENDDNKVDEDEVTGTEQTVTSDNKEITDNTTTSSDDNTTSDTGNSDNNSDNNSDDSDQNAGDNSNNNDNNDNNNNNDDNTDNNDTDNNSDNNDSDNNDSDNNDNTDNSDTSTKHNVSLNIPGGGSINSGNVTEYVEGEGAVLPNNVTKEPTDYVEYIFDGWYTQEDGGEKVTSISALETGDIELFAHFIEKPRQYELVLNTKGGIVNAGNLTAYSYDADNDVILPTNLTKTSTAECTYTFDGWYTQETGGVKVERISAGEVGDKIYYAHWIEEARVYSISVNASAGGSAVAEQNGQTIVSAAYGSTVDIIATADTGYAFTGWTVDAGAVTIDDTSISARSFTMPAENVTLTASFDAQSYDVILHPNGGNDVSGGNNLTYTYGVGLTLPTGITRDSDAEYVYSFAGWFTSADINGVQVTAIGSDETGRREFYAHWNETVRKYSVTPSVGAHGAMFVKQGNSTITEAEWGSTVTVDVMPDAEYEVDSVTYTVDGGAATEISLNNGSGTFEMPKGNVTVSVSFKIKTYAITASYDQEKGSMTVKVGDNEVTEAKAGDTVKLYVSANTGYAAGTPTTDNANVTVSFDTQGGYYYFTMPSGAITVQGSFTPDNTSYTVHVLHSSNDKGSYSADKTSALSGENVTINFSSINTGYTAVVSCRYYSGSTVVPVTKVSETQFTFTMPASDVSVSVRFIAPYSITINSVTNGTVSSNMSSADVYDEVRLTVTPSAGYAIGDVVVTDSDGDAVSGSFQTTDDGERYCFEMPASDVTVSVTFNALRTISFVSNEYVNASASVGNSTVTTAVSGDRVVINASVKTSYQAAYRISSVSVAKENGGTVSVTENNGNYEFTMPDENVSITVNAVKKVTGVSLDETTKTAAVGDTFDLTATIAPSDAANKNVTWESSDDDVIRVTPDTDNPLIASVECVKDGSASVTVTTEDGAKTASCAVTVELASGSGIYYTTSVAGTEITMNVYAQGGTGRTLIDESDPDIDPIYDAIGYSYNSAKVIFNDEIHPTNSHWFRYVSTTLTVEGIANFKTDQMTSMSAMFYNCSGLQSLDFSGFDTSNVTDMSGMFAGAGFTSLDLRSFDTRNVTDMSSMFRGEETSPLTQVNLSSFDTSHVTDMKHMFTDCTSLVTLDLSHFNTSNVENMYEMFCNCSNLQTIIASSNFVTSALVTTNPDEAPDQNLFAYCSALTGGNGTTYQWQNTTREYARIDAVGTPGYFTAAPAATNFYQLVEYDDSDNATITVYDHQVANSILLGDSFRGGLEALYYNNFGDDNTLLDKIVKIVIADDLYPTNLNCCFYEMEGLREVEGLNKLHTENVTDMNRMFYNTWINGTLDLSSFDTSNVTDMGGMFESCSASVIDLRSFDTSSVTDFTDMFWNCGLLETIYASNSFVVSNTATSTRMFGSDQTSLSNLVGGAGTTWSGSNANDYTYAHIDGGTANPGYFTAAGNSGHSITATGALASSISFYVGSTAVTSAEEDDIVEIHIPESVFENGAKVLGSLSVSAGGNQVMAYLDFDKFPGSNGNSTGTEYIYRFSMPDDDVEVSVSLVETSAGRLGDYISIEFVSGYNGTYIDDDGVLARIGSTETYASVINSGYKEVRYSYATFYDNSYALTLGARYDFVIEVPSGCTLTSLANDSSAEMNYEMLDSTHYAGYIVIPASMSSDYIVISITPNE